MERDKRVLAMEETITHIFGQDIWDDSALDTAHRILRAWSEFSPAEEIPFSFTTFPATANQMIVVKNIEFSSLCAHHLFPFDGVAHVGYVPNRLMVGLSKVPRLVEHWAHRPSTQETLTAHLADDMKHRLDAMGVAVVLEARHMCMACRGVRSFNASMVTSEMRGIFLTSGEARSEFLSLIGAK